MKRSDFIRIFAVLGLFFSVMPSHADQTIRVGIHHFEPMVFADEHGQAKGLFVDVLNHIAQKENWQIRYVFGTWQECPDRLDNGDIDIIAGIAFSDERANKFDFTSEYLFLDWTQVYKPKGSNIETLFDLEGKTIASLKGSVITHDFKNLLEQFGIRCTVLEKDDYHQVAEAVRQKEADAGICMNIRLLHLKKYYDIELTHISFSPKKIRFAVRKGFNELLLSTLDSHISALKADKHSVYYELYDKWTDIYRPKNIVPAWIWGAGLTIIGIAILLLLFIGILNRQVRIRTSELTKTNEDLRKSEERFRTIANYTYDWEYWIGTDGKFVYVSPSCERITGYRSDEFMNDCKLLGKIIHPDDKNSLTCYFKNTSDHHKAFSDFRIITKSGEERWVNHVCHPVYNDKEEWIGRRASNRDITERRQMEDKLRESEEKYRAMYDNAPLAYQSLNEAGEFLDVNPMWLKALGYNREEIIGRWFGDFLHPDFAEHFKINFPAFRHRGYISDVRFRMRRKDGTFILVSFEGRVGYTPEGRFRQTYCTFKDITQEYESERALQESEKKYRSLAENSLDYIMRYDKECRHLYMNQAGLKVSGLIEEDIIGKTHSEAGFDEKLSCLWEEKITSVFETGEASQTVFEWDSVEGKIYLDWRLFPEFDGNGKVDTVLGISRDISEIKQAEQELKKRENLFSKVLEILPIGLWIADKDGRLMIGNPAGIRIWGAAPYVGEEEYHVFRARRLPSGQEIAPDDWALTKSIRQGITISDELLEIDAFDGQKKIILNYTAPVFGDDGSIQGAIVVNYDITERKRAEEMLRDSQYRLNLALRSAGMGVWEWDISNNQRYFDERSCRILGVNPSTFTGTSDEFFNMVYPDDREMIRAMLKTAVENSAPYDPEYRVVLPDGVIRHIKSIGGLHCDDAGNPAKISGILWDITERKKAEAEKATLESRLRQAQSMEAIGTLAGGIAHDFNNILFPIIGYTEMTLDDTPKESRAYKNLQEVYQAAIRARDLVGQILTFSRQKEQEKRIFKLHHIVKEALKLLRSTLPSTIRITQNIDPDCDPAEGDPTQIHQIVMNLCTNAYHAMQDKGGEMKVSLTEIELLPEDMTAYPDMMPGVYLKLSVSDTGSGIPESILGKIFDPFFTTKPTGQGTGLGLSVVHGIVKQMGGDIRVYSEVGVGTAFVVYIPAVRSVSSDSDPSAASNVLIPAGTEHILLVDDEEPILDMLGTMLGGLGYRISSRTSSVEALKVFENKSDDFDIVITDMTMPNMTGVQLARKLLAIRPDIPIILCTGFSQHISYEKAKHAGIRGYLMKPVIRSEMAKMIRKVLEEIDVHPSDKSPGYEPKPV